MTELSAASMTCAGGYHIFVAVVNALVSLFLLALYTDICVFICRRFWPWIERTTGYAPWWIRLDRMRAQDAKPPSPKGDPSFARLRVIERPKTC